MKQFRGIAKSPVAPPTDVVWLYRGVLKYFDNGEWIEIKTSNGGGGDTSYSIFKVSNTPEDKAHNLELSQNIGFDEVVAVKVEGSINDTQYNTIGIYHNGYITALQNSTQILFNVDFNSGEITVLESNDISTYLPYVNLEVGNSEEIKQHNLERLTDGFFFVKLDYGYGVGDFHPSIGNGIVGKANITTSSGHEVSYDIYNDGKIEINPDYIKPNEPYSVLLTSSQIGVELDDITGGKVSRAGELIVTGSTGPITYTRTSDSTSAAIYFTDDNKDGSTTILTYSVSTKTITSSKRTTPFEESDPKFTEWLNEGGVLRPLYESLPNVKWNPTTKMYDVWKEQGGISVTEEQMKYIYTGRIYGSGYQLASSLVKAAVAWAIGGINLYDVSIIYCGCEYIATQGTFRNPNFNNLARLIRIEGSIVLEKSANFSNNSSLTHINISLQAYVSSITVNFSKSPKINFDSFAFIPVHYEGNKICTIKIDSFPYSLLTGTATDEQYITTGHSKEEWMQIVTDSTTKNITFNKDL